MGRGKLRKLSHPSARAVSNKSLLLYVVKTKIDIVKHNNYGSLLLSLTTPNNRIGLKEIHIVLT